jgi:hypothetical protein
MFGWLKQKKAPSPAAKSGPHRLVYPSRSHALAGQERRQRSDDDDGLVVGLATGIPIPLTPSSLMGAAMHQSLIDDSDCHRTSRDASGCRAVATQQLLVGGNSECGSSDSGGSNRGSCGGD